GPDLPGVPVDRDVLAAGGVLVDVLVDDLRDGVAGLLDPHELAGPGAQGEVPGRRRSGGVPGCLGPPALRQAPGREDLQLAVLASGIDPAVPLRGRDRRHRLRALVRAAEVVPADRG